MDPRRLRVGDLGSHFCAAAGHWLQFCCKTTVLALWELPKGPGWVSQEATGGPGGRAKLGGCQVRYKARSVSRRWWCVPPLCRPQGYSWGRYFGPATAACE